MKTQTEIRPVTDEFEPIELGSVAEETKGGISEGREFVQEEDATKLP